MTGADPLMFVCAEACASQSPVDRAFNCSLRMQKSSEFDALKREASCAMRPRGSGFGLMCRTSPARCREDRKSVV